MTKTETMTYDRNAEDVGNIVHLEHLNLRVPDQILATQFYVSALGLTRDPYLMTGTDNMWVNAGRTQFHLPLGAQAQRMRGTVSLVIPGRAALLQRLQRAARDLAHTAFQVDASRPDLVAVHCPWGNLLHCHSPASERFAGVGLGLVQLDFNVPLGSAEGIARFYREVFATPAVTARSQQGAWVTRVKVGVGQALVFTESSAELPAYDGHHLQIYVADFSGPHRRLQALGAIAEESNTHQYRVQDIVDPQSGAPLFRLEHEVRSLSHPLCGRPLMNRNPAQTNRDYRPGADAFVPGINDD